MRTHRTARLVAGLAACGRGGSDSTPSDWGGGTSTPSTSPADPAAWTGDEMDANRQIGWTLNWRMLESCNNGCANPEADGLWSAWSPKWQVDFPAATTSWTVPPSNTVMLP